jgi:serine/threonine protein kinase
MLTGASPFTGKNTQETFANILSAPTPPIQKPAHIPRSVRDATYRALAKDPGGRFATAAEFSEALLVDDAEHAGTGDDSRSGWKKLLPWWNA